MSTENLVARKNEINRLETCMRETTAQLVILYGRRRIGKTFLITEFFDGRFDFRFTGAYKEKKDVQLRHFAEELSGHIAREIDPPKSWDEAFRFLKAYLESLPKDEKHVVFFDEMPWMDTLHSGFLSAFEYFWNSFGSSLHNLIFIVCGSASSWMTKNIAQNKGGLFNRQACSLYLRPFTLCEAEEYLAAHKGIHWSRYDMTLCYMALGGIPYYLSLLSPAMSPADNIDNLFFRKRSELWNEFAQLYRTLFSNSDRYISIVEELSQHRYGLSRDEIAKKTGIAENGILSEMLENLVKSDFIRVETLFGRKNAFRYQLCDYYTWFYFRFIKDRPGRDEHYWRNSFQDQARKVWSSLTFEQVCKDHISQIKHKLGISGVLSDAFSWSVRGSSEKVGTQIDLIIDRKDNVMNLCEIKFSTAEYVIDKDEDRKLRNKINVFQTETRTKKTIQTTLVTTYGMKSNLYSSIINTQVVLDDLFHA